MQTTVLSLPKIMIKPSVLLSTLKMIMDKLIYDCATCCVTNKKDMYNKDKIYIKKHTLVAVSEAETQDHPEAT